MTVCLNEWVIDSTDSFKRLIQSEMRQVITAFMNWLLIHWHLIRSKTWIHSSNETPLCCSKTQNSSAVALIWTIFISEIEQKQSILCLKCETLNFNFLFIKLLLYKITLQSCWNILVVQYCIPKSYIINFSLFFFFLLPQYVSITFCVCSWAHFLTHSLKLRKPHLAQHKFIISHHKCDVKTDRLRNRLMRKTG